MTLLAMRASAEVPLPVARWLEAAWPAGLDEIDTLLLEGPVRVRRGHVWLHGDGSVRLDAGRGYVSDVRLALGPVGVIRRTDAFVDARGVTSFGRGTSTGPEIDHAGFIALWALSMLFPSCWARLPGLRWTAVDDAEARLVLPFEHLIETAGVRFEPDRAECPVAFEAVRARFARGPKVSWRVDFGDWRWSQGLLLPTRLQATWAGDPVPSFDMRVETVVPNAPVEDDLERVRRILEAHGAVVR